MDELIDSAVGLDNFVIPEIPIANTRAGLYVHLNASVGTPFPYPSLLVLLPVLTFSRPACRTAADRRPCNIFLLAKQIPGIFNTSYVHSCTLILTIDL